MQNCKLNNIKWKNPAGYCIISSYHITIEKESVRCED